MAYPLVRWVFDDPVTSESYTFGINPNAGGSPNFQKTFQYASTVAPGGKTLIFEGADPAQKLEFSGDILYQAEYEAFVTWWTKRYQIKLTDDLGRQFHVVIESFNPERVRNATLPWKHTYKASATIVDWPA